VPPAKPDRLAPAERPFALSPASWPVRWRLAVVSAGLTFAILLVFAGVVGSLAQDRLTNDFRNELESTATQLAFRLQLEDVTGPTPLSVEGMALPSDATVRLVDASGAVLGSTPNAPRLPPGPPRIGTVTFGDLEVATRPIIFTANEFSSVFVQYARDHDELDATIDRLWLFLAIGVACGTILATLAGLAVAGRAMRPIAALTATAREIASTRDPSRSMPQPEADDEVGELARTLDAMLGELDAARSEAQHLVQAQREFVADASHELRTPLTSILANLELLHEHLESQGRGSSEDAEMVASALRSSRRMRRLVGDLLLLARADAGRIGARAECDLAEIAAAALAEVRPVADGREIELRLGEPVPVVGDADELHRLTVNLLDNAVRHTPAGARVDVAVRRDGDEAVLTVDDDGPGLPAGMEEQVFARFVRGSGPADLVADGGTGLGLAIVRAVAESHGGTVSAGTSPLGGARFEVRLPAGDATPEPYDEPAPAGATTS
jgi:two-component system, OmpR family, sensor kinase